LEVPTFLVRLISVLAALSFCAALSFYAAPALAQDKEPAVATPEQKAEAQLLFDEGRRRMKEGKVAAACDAFEGSQKLDPAIGTKLNLATCWQKIGRFASAWIMFREAETISKRAGQEKRQKLAKRRADDLEPRLSKLVVEVTAPVDGMVVSRNGIALTSSSWGIPVPVDPGLFTITATAPGKKAWSKELTIEGEGKSFDVSIPALEDAPEEPADVPTVVEPKDDVAPVDEGERTLFLALGGTALGVGVLGAAAGGLLRFLALDKDEESLAFCRPEDVTICTQEGADLRGEAESFQTGSIIAWAGGGALVATGVVLLLLAPNGADDGGETARVDASWGATAGADHLYLSTRIRW
jgi:hypothetical protein